MNKKDIQALQGLYESIRVTEANGNFMPTEEEMLAAAQKMLQEANKGIFKSAQLGHVNSWHGTVGDIYDKVSELHVIWKKKDPEHHNTHIEYPYGRYRGVSKTKCSCGFSYSVDSSD